MACNALPHRQIRTLPCHVDSRPLARRERAAIIYQHEARGADLVITSAIDAHIETAKATHGQHTAARRK